MLQTDALNFEEIIAMCNFVVCHNDGNKNRLAMDIVKTTCVQQFMTN